MCLCCDLCKGFVAFDKIKSLLQDENGKISGPRTVLAGFGAGFTESLIAVTPFESIKTQLSVMTNPRLAMLTLDLCAKFKTDKHYPGLMTGNQETLACAVSFMVAR